MFLINNQVFSILIFFIFSCDSKYDRISSRDFPLVSGSINMVNKVLARQNTLNIDHTHSTPNFIISDGYVLHTTNHRKNPIVCTTPFITPIINTKYSYNK